MESCIFCQISQGQTDTPHLYSDERCFVIEDIHPAAPTHLLIIPHQHITSLAGGGPEQEALVGHLFTIAEEMARRERLVGSGYRLVINQGRDAGQGVAHLHLHLLGGKGLPSLG
jgi:histidine triad (HIT) family protein